MCKKCILCGRINYGGARFEGIHGRKKSGFICLDCINKGRKPEALKQLN